MTNSAHAFAKGVLAVCPFLAVPQVANDDLGGGAKKSWQPEGGKRLSDGLCARGRRDYRRGFSLVCSGFSVLGLRLQGVGCGCRG